MCHVPLLEEHNLIANLHWLAVGGDDTLHDACPYA